MKTRGVPSEDDHYDQSPLLSSNEFSHNLIELSILKLDNTSFGVRVNNKASVHDLKEAIQREFTKNQDGEETDIQWGYVWGNFCLTYQAYKLTDDKSLLSSFGIKDSDQLCFVRHISDAIHGEKLRARKNGKRPLFRKKSSDGVHVPKGRSFNQIEFQWTHIFKKWLSYSKLLIMSMKSDRKNLHLKQ